MKKTTTLIAFDLDGTLIDSLPVTLRLMRESLKYFLKRDFTETEVTQYFGLTEEDIFRKFTDEKTSDQILKHYFDSIDRNATSIHAVSGVISLLVELKKLNYRIALYTARGRTSTEKLLRVTQILPHLEWFITGSDVKHPKPDPEGLKEISKHFGVQAAEMCYVGDSPLDIEMASRFHCKSIGVIWAEKKHEAALASKKPLFIASEANEVLNYFKKA